jgi:acyl transferase domain-containing protein/NADPH:quinone reductase-like Zn-dependent oxidoreductase/SAM-dependent methyltransferase/acyl carrier protein
MEQPGPNNRALLKEALVELKRLQTRLQVQEQHHRQQLAEQLAELQAERSAAIAIIGLGCRFPQSPNPQALWHHLEQGTDLIEEIPKQRWDIEQYYDPDPDAQGKMYSRRGYFLTHVDQFDPGFFRISPREAQMLDPQHRLLLEVGWESLEAAGIAPHSLKGSQTGVFIGMMTHDYQQLVADGADVHTVSSNGAPLAAGRVAYTLGLQGPTLTVETACSSSLVAVHLACQSLRNQEAQMALVGGVNLMLTPHISIMEARAHMHAPDGRCKTFDDAADGMGRGEGCGVVVLKRLTDAQAAGDPILAVIRGSAVNHDGASSGLTVPNGLAQEALIKQALANAQVEPGAIDYVECHGTGTALGDPIEVEALVNAYGQMDMQTNDQTSDQTWKRDRPLLIGSVKTNLGHTEGAAGIAALIKTVLALRHEKLPRHRHLQEPNCRIDWEQIPVAIPTTTTPWPRGKRPRLAGISSFGVSGTNAHVIVEEAPPRLLSKATKVANPVYHPYHLLTLSAQTKPALHQLVDRYIAYLQQDLQQDLQASIADICYTANTGRSDFEHRLAIVVQDNSVQNLVQNNLVQDHAIQDSVQDSVVQNQVAQDQAAQDQAELLEKLYSYQNQQVMTGVFWGEQSQENSSPHAPPLALSLPELASTNTQKWQQFYTHLTHLGQAFVQGHGIDWSPLYGHGQYQKVELPTYPFQRQSHWIEHQFTSSTPSKQAGFQVNAPDDNWVPVHPLLGKQFFSASHPQQIQFETHIQENYPAYLADHRIFDRAIFPTTAYLEIALAAGAQYFQTPNLLIKDLGLHQGLVLTSITTRLQTVLTPVNNLDGAYQWQIFSCKSHLDLDCPQDSPKDFPQWQLQASGTIQVLQQPGIESSQSQILPIVQTHTQTVNPSQINIQQVNPLRIDLQQHLQQCPQSITPQTHYQQYQDHGIAYGPNFQGIQDIWRGNEQAIVQVTLPDQLCSEVADYQFHPALLDSALQVVIHTLTGLNSGNNNSGGNTRNNNQSLYLPVGIEQFKVYRRPGLSLWAIAQLASPLTDSNPIPDILSINLTLTDLDGEIVAIFTGLHLKSAFPGALGTEENSSLQTLQTVSIADWFYAVQWQPKSRWGRLLPPDYLVNPQKIVAQLAIESLIQKQVGQIDLAAYQAVLAELETLSLSYIIEALDSIGWEYKIGDRFSLDTAMQKLQVIPKQRQLFLRLLQILKQEKIIEKQETQKSAAQKQATPKQATHWHVLQNLKESVHRVNPAIQSPLLQQQYPAAQAEITLLHRCASRLGPMLQGLADPTHLVFPGGDLTAANAFYQNSPGAQILNQILQGVLEQAIAQLSPSRGLRILEIGAGTGATTSYLLPHLPDGQTAYYFTDLGQIFINQAQEKFRDYPFIHYQTLDIDQDPLAQGFEPQQFDVIIAANVLHATRDLPQALLHVRQLLAHQGMLILWEVTTRYRWIDLIFGLLDGWWKPEARDESLSHPLLSRDQWQQYLVQAGFGQIVSLPESGNVPEVLLQQSILVATAQTQTQVSSPVDTDLSQPATQPTTQSTTQPTSQSTTQSTTEQPKSWLILADSQGLGQELAAHFGAWGQDCILIPWQGARSILELEQRLTEILVQSSGIYGVVQCWTIINWAMLDVMTPNEETLGGMTPDRTMASGTMASGTTFNNQSLSPQSLATLSELGCGSTLTLIQALAKVHQSPTPRFWIVTQGAQPVPDLVPDLVSDQVTDQASDQVPRQVTDRATTTIIPGIAQSSVWGLGKVIAMEHPELQCVRIDLDPNASLEQQAQDLFGEIWSEDSEDQVALRANHRYVPRLMSLEQLPPEQLLLEQLPGEQLPGEQFPTGQLQIGSKSLSLPSQPFQLDLSQPGDLDTLMWIPTTRRSPGFGEVEIRVQATGLNFLDLVAALDLLPQEADGVSQQHLLDLDNFGGECAGEIVAIGDGVDGFAIGDRVMAFCVGSGSFKQYVTVTTDFVIAKPACLSVEEAAAIPINFLTAHYALHHCAKITAGDRVLIHAAAGGTGMAAVQIAQQVGAEVWATASPPKWETLRGMGIQHIMNSRTLEFAQQIQDCTQGQGVDIVLDFLTAGDFIPATLSALGHRGRFIEIGKRDVWTSEQMAAARPDVAYTIVDLVKESQKHPILIQTLLQDLATQFTGGTLQKPLVTRFPAAQVIDAFRYMQQARHIGKIVIHQFQGQELEQVQVSTPISSNGLETNGLETSDFETSRLETNQTRVQGPISPVTFSPNGTYLITGGLGGLGLRVAQWLVENGAKHLALLGRHGPNERVIPQLQALEQAGAQVTVVQVDVADFDALSQALSPVLNPVLHPVLHPTLSPIPSQTPQSCQPPLKGIIHAAGLLSDGILQNQTWQSFETVMNPKVQGAWNLHLLSQNQDLDCFVLFSSGASLVGSPGQGNHVAANAFLDALAHYRRAQGLPGLSINWGIWTDIGSVANRATQERLQVKGIGGMVAEQGIACLEHLWDFELPQVGVLPIDRSQLPAELINSPFWSAIRAQTVGESMAAGANQTTSNVLEQFRVLPPGDRHFYLVNYVRAQVAQVLGIKSLEQVDIHQGFFDLGLDSLTSVELRNRLQNALQCQLPATVALEYPTVAKFVDYLLVEVMPQMISPEISPEIPPEISPEIPPTTDLIASPISTSTDLPVIESPPSSESPFPESPTTELSSFEPLGSGDSNSGDSNSGDLAEAEDIAAIEDIAILLARELAEIKEERRL